MKKIIGTKTKQPTLRSAPVLRFTPTAWAKLLFVRDFGVTEVGAFGITDPSDFLLVTQLELVKQTCTSVSVVFDDAAVADFFDRQVDLGRKPAEFARIWIHTHPGRSAEPSRVDESTFARVFGTSDWAVMFILAQEGQTYARLQFAAGPGGSLLLPVDIDYRQRFAASEHAAWQEEYQAQVSAAQDEWLNQTRAQSAQDAWEADQEPITGYVRDLVERDEEDPFYYAEEPWYAL